MIEMLSSAKHSKSPQGLAVTRRAPAATSRLDRAVGEHGWSNRRLRRVGRSASSATAVIALFAASPGGASAGTPVSASTDGGVAPYAPVATVNSPTPARYHYSELSDGLPQMWFDGQATDPQDGAIPGTRMRWVATDGGGRNVELCRGSNWPSSRDPGSTLTLLRDCSEFAAARLDHGTWRIELQAVDRAGNRGSATSTVMVIYVPA